MSTYRHHLNALGVFLPDLTTDGNAEPTPNMYFSNGSVGINTTTPAARLDVAGTILSSSTITSTNNLVALSGGIELGPNIFTNTDLLGYSNASYFASNAAGWSSNNFIRRNANDLISGNLTASNGTQQFSLQTSNDTIMLFGCSNSWANAPIIVPSGRFSPLTPGQLLLSAPDNSAITFNVHSVSGDGVEIARVTPLGMGINTQSPSEKLDVSGNANISENLYVRSGLIAHSNVTFSNTLSNLGDAYFASNVTINGQLQSSNLRIGATTYTETSLNNTINQSSFSSNMLQNYLPLTGGTLVNNLLINAGGPISYSLSNNKGGSVMMGLSYTPGNYSASANSNDFIIRNTALTGKLLFQNGVLGAALTVNSNNFVGINNSAPVESLHVTGKIYATQQILADSNDSSNTPAFSFLQDSNSGMWQPSNDTLGFSIGGIDRIRINDQGFFGILTSNPTVPLDVVGQIKTSSGLVINSSTYTDTTLNAWSNTLYTLSNTTTTVSNTATFASNLAVTASNMHSSYLPLTGGTLSGNVVISAPTSASFQLANNKGGNAEIGLSYTPGAYSGSANSNDLVMRNINSLGRLHFQSGVGLSALTINSNNFVGIGTNIPQYSLDIQGSVGINKGTAVANKLLTLFDLGPTDTAATACNFYGFGINPAILRYQTPANTTHGFYIGTNNTMNLTNTALSVTGSGVFGSNLVSQSTGTVGMNLILSTGCFDLVNTTTTYGLREDGNPGIAGSMFHSNFFNGSNCSGEAINWTRARLMLRGCRLNTNDTPSVTAINIRCFNSNDSLQKTLTTIQCRDYGANQGFCTNISPFFSIANSNRPYLGLQLATTGGITYRVGQVHIIFSA